MIWEWHCNALLKKQITSYRPWMSRMYPDLEIQFPSRIQDPNLKPLQPLYVDGWASLHVNMNETYN